MICAGASTIPEDIFLISAEKLAELVSDDDLEKGSLYPPLEDIRECSLKIATKVMDYAYQKGLTTFTNICSTNLILIFGVHY